MIRILLLIMFAGICLVNNITAQINNNIFYQKVSNTISLPPSAGKNVIRLFYPNNIITAITNNGVFRYQNGKWWGNAGNDNWVMAALDGKQNIWLASQKIISNEHGRIIPLPVAMQKDSISCMFWENDQTLHIGTNGGLYTWTGKWEQVPELKAIAVNDVVADSGKSLWVASGDGLWKRANGKWLNLDDLLMAEGNQRKYYALTTINNGADVVFSTPYTVGCIAVDNEHWVWRSTEGLPYGPVNCIRAAGNDFWFGTAKGAIQKDSAWHYYHGKRWLPAARVNDMLKLPTGEVWIATPEGISEIKNVSITLEQKAAYYESVIDKRHNRRGLINISRLATPGDTATSYMENEDNDGLWTSCYLAAACFRYAVSKSPDAKLKAIRTFEALERLEMVTGIPGYPARSYATASDKVKQSRSPHPKQWHFSPDGKWQWLDDTSSDEITGHIFTLSLFYELVADTAQKIRVKALISRIVTHIVDNDFRLIDLDGKPTRWGIWHPDSLNHSENWMYERGLNSLQILSFLKTAIHYTGNPKFEKAYQTLVKKHGYARNAVAVKMYGPYETSHSDDILNLFPYYGLLRYAGNDTSYTYFVKSLERSWRNVRNDRMPVWNVIASALLGKDCDLDIALKELREYPLDLIDWTMDNSHRWDLETDPMVDRGRQQQAVYPVPTPESGVSRWNTNPKRLKVGQAGQTEETGTYFLFAYWMGRYYGFWKE